MTNSYKIRRITDDLIVIDKDSVFEKSTGNIYNLDSFYVKSKVLAYIDALGAPEDVKLMDTTAQIVVGLDSKKIDLSLKTSDGVVPVRDGFLVEVFLSGTKLDGYNNKKLYYSEVNNAADDGSSEDGFSNYFTLEIDQ